MVVELVMGGEVGGRVEARRWTGLPLEKLRNVVEVVVEAGRVVSWGLGVARRVVEVVEVVGNGQAFCTMTHSGITVDFFFCFRSRARIRNLRCYFRGKEKRKK